MADSIETIFTITRDEYIRAMRRHYRTRLRIGRDIVGGLIAICCGLYLLNSTDQFAFAWLLIVVGTFLLVLVAYAILVMPSMIYRSQPKLKSRYRLQFDDNGIRFRTNDIDAQLKWQMYHSWLCDDEFYILYHGTRDLSVIPIRSLPEDRCQQFEALLKRNIGPNKTK